MSQVKRYRNGQRPSANYSHYYIDGNTVRKPMYEPARPARPVRREQRPTQPAKRQVTRDPHIIERQRRVNEKVAMRNREKALKIDLKYTLFLCAAVLVVLASCVFYLSMQTKVSAKTREISALESQLATLADNNLTARERINESLDLEYIRQYATEVLGMVYPSESQIVKYQSSTEDYVKQYQDIPQSSN